MKPMPPKIRDALSFTMHDWELWAAEWRTADEECAFYEDLSDYPNPTEDQRHIAVLAKGIRDLLGVGHVDAAIQVAILLGEILHQDEFDSSIESVYLERGKREAEAIKEAALRRWGSREDRRRIDGEIRDLVDEVIAEGQHAGAKQICHEVARRMNCRHPGLKVSPRKIRRVVTGH